MVILVDKNSPFFDKVNAKKHFEINKENLDDKDGFEALLDVSLFFNVHNNGYVGSIFVYPCTDGRYYLGGYAVRKRYKEVIEAIKTVSDMFIEVYAETRHKHAVYALLRGGFEWFDRDKKLLIKRGEIK
jgi:hypothetical protein